MDVCLAKRSRTFTAYEVSGGMEGKVQDFRRLSVWQKAFALSVAVYRLTSTFPKSELYMLTGQLRRSAVSIPSNIAEGSGRATDKEMAHFLAIALGSAAELECQLLISRDLEYLGLDKYSAMEEQVQEVRRMLNAFLSRLGRPRPKPARQPK